MTVESIAFRDFIRGQIPADVLLLFDKKSRKNKGLYISAEYAEEILSYIKKNEQEKKEKKKHALLDFVGAFGELDDPEATHQAIKASKYE